MKIKSKLKSKFIPVNTPKIFNQEKINIKEKTNIKNKLKFIIPLPNIYDMGKK